MIKKIFPGKPGLSACAAWLVSLYIIYSAACVSHPRVSSWDVLGYYLYLPQTFIEQDPGNYDLEPLQKARTQYELSPWLYQVHPTEKGSHVSQYPLGMACFYLPGFLTGHCFAKILGYPADGYSPPYQYSQVWFYALYCIIGFWLLRKVLRRYFSDLITALLLLIVFFGTNYYVYATGGYGMPHAYLFLAYVLVTWLTIRWHEQHTFKNSFFLGLIIGIMVICRPTEILALLIPLFWQVHSLSSFRQKISLLFVERLRYTLVFITGFMVLPLLQVFYWKLYTGEAFHYSYINPGEGFEFLHPHLYEFLFSFRKGWFVYTPVFLPAVLFLLLGGHRKKEYWLPFALFTCANIYVLASWSNWWYATSFGQRSVIQSYPVCLFGLGLLFERISTRKKLFITATGLAVLFCAFNLFQAWQYNRGIIEPGRMTRDYYFAVLGKTSIPPGADTLLLVDRSVTLDTQLRNAERYHPTKIFRMKTDDATGTFRIPATEKCSDKIFKLPYRDLTTKDHAWIKISLDVKRSDSTGQQRLMVSPCFLNKREKAYAWMSTNVMEQVKPGENGWMHFTTYYLTPEIRLSRDRLNVQLENLEGGDFTIRNFMLEVFEPKVEH